jgi:hypothetical protein
MLARMRHSRVSTALAALPAIAAAFGMTIAAGTASGTLAYKGKTKDYSAPLKFSYLIKGPDEVDASKNIRRLILSTADLEKKLAACTTMSCTTSDLDEGIAIDIGAGPRLNYWVVFNGQLVQYSGTHDPDALTTTADTAARLAGKIVFDDSKAGGAKIDAAFDTTVTKTVTKGR